MTIAGVAHIYAQGHWHDEAYIVADRDALLALRAAIDKALTEGHGATTLTPTDGEGYDLHIVRVDADWQSPEWQDLAMPYTDEVAGGRGGKHPSSLIPSEEVPR